MRLLTVIWRVSFKGPGTFLCGLLPRPKTHDAGEPVTPNQPAGGKVETSSVLAQGKESSCEGFFKGCAINDGAKRLLARQRPDRPVDGRRRSRERTTSSCLLSADSLQSEPEEMSTSK